MPRPASHLALRLVALVLALALPAPAAADDAARARFHDQRAREHFAAGRYEAALQEFFLEQRLTPNPRVAYNIALCFEELRRDDDTFLFFSEYVASDDPDEERRRYALERLEALSERVARVRVTTDPPDARVYVDQRDRGAFGATPVVLAVPAGEHRLFVERDGYHPVELTVEAVRGQEVGVERELRQILGRVRVQAGAVAGTARLRDAAHQRTIEGMLGAPFDAPPGTWEIEVEALGHRPYRGIVRVEADRLVEVPVDLEPLPPPTGAITVTANAPGALVRVDGEPAGFVPLALGDVEVGTHRLEVSQQGLQSYGGELEVLPGERTWVTANLTPPPSTSRSELAWVFGGIGAAGLLAGGITAGFAIDVHYRLDRELQAAMSDRVDGLLAEGRSLDAAAIAISVVGAVTLGVGALIFVLTESVEDTPPSASVSTEAR